MGIVKVNIGAGTKIKEHPVKVDFSILMDEATQGTKFMTEVITRIRPGQTLNPSHSHKDIEEVVYVLEGEGAVYVDGEFCEIRKGDSVLFSANSKHTAKNTGASTLVLLCFFSSPNYRGKGLYITHEDIEF